MAEQTQPALAVGQVWRSPSGKQKRVIVRVKHLDGRQNDIWYHTKSCPRIRSLYVPNGMPGWTLVEEAISCA